MNKLIACALLGFGLASGVVACGDDDDGTPSENGGTDAGGSNAAGKNSGGSSASGSNAGGKGGTGDNGGAGGTTAGGTSSGGSSVGGDGMGGDGSVGGETSVGGENAGGAGGAGGEGGAPGEVEPEPEQLATPFWLANFCDATCKEELKCDGSIEWATCYNSYSPFITGGDLDGECVEEDSEGTKFLTLMGALDALAADCGLVDLSDFSCNAFGKPTASEQECQDAFAAMQAAYAVCKPS